MASYDLSDSDYNLVAEGLDVLLDRTQRARRKAQNHLSRAKPKSAGQRALSKQVKKLERKEDDIESVRERLGKTLSRDMADWY